MNTAMIKLFPGARPYDRPPEEHVWLALLSRGAFIGRGVPLKDPGLFMAEPSLITQILVKNSDTSPETMIWRNQRSVGDNSVRAIEGEFKWGRSTNISADITVPLESEVTINIVETNGVRSLIAVSRLTIESTDINQLDAERKIDISSLSLAGRNVVYDYRLGNLFERESIAYDIHDGHIPDTDALVVRDAFDRKFTFKANGACSHGILVWTVSVVEI